MSSMYENEFYSRTSASLYSAIVVQIMWLWSLLIYHFLHLLFSKGGGRILTSLSLVYLINTTNPTLTPTLTLTLTLTLALTPTLGITGCGRKGGGSGTQDWSSQSTPRSCATRQFRHVPEAHGNPRYNTDYLDPACWPPAVIWHGTSHSPTHSLTLHCYDEITTAYVFA